jgi:hypothetical protein
MKHNTILEGNYFYCTGPLNSTLPKYYVTSERNSFWKNLSAPLSANEIGDAPQNINNEIGDAPQNINSFSETESNDKGREIVEGNLFKTEYS